MRYLNNCQCLCVLQFTKTLPQNSIQLFSQIISHLNSEKRKSITIDYTGYYNLQCILSIAETCNIPFLQE